MRNDGKEGEGVGKKGKEGEGLNNILAPSHPLSGVWGVGCGKIPAIFRSRSVSVRRIALREPESLTVRCFQVSSGNDTRMVVNWSEKPRSPKTYPLSEDLHYI